MPTVDVVKSSPIVRSPRVQQLEGMFDVPPAERSEQRWQAELPIEARDWRIGLIVGPSGCGKSTVARELFGEALVESHEWPAKEPILDGFPRSMSIKQITGLLSSVGFSSPPSWLRPFGVLSTGEQFRVTIARALAEAGQRGGMTCIDEFTSVIDRTVARIGSAAISKCIRRGDHGRFVAVSCHSDIIDWLDPDWIYRPADNTFKWRDETEDAAAGCDAPGRRRPAIELEVRRVHRRCWSLFRAHHYLDHDLHPTAECYCGFVEGEPAVFTAVVHFPHDRAPGWREHRTVCRPDFQGVGLGNAMSELIASLYVRDKRYFSVTANPAMVRHRARSPLWHMRKKPRLEWSKQSGLPTDKDASGRIVAAFDYVGPPASEAQVEALKRDQSIYVPSAGGERVIAALRKQDGLTVGALRRRTGLSSTGVDRELQEMVRTGIAVREGSGGHADPYSYRLIGEPR